MPGDSDTNPADPYDFLEGRNYRLDLTSGVLVQPAGMGSLLYSYLSQMPLIEVEAVGGGALDLLVGFEEEGVPAQSLCIETFPLSDADFSAAPFFSFGPEVVATTSWSVENLELSGTFAADGSEITDVYLFGAIDLRASESFLYAQLGYGAAETCDLAQSFGVSCVLCQDGEPYCLIAELTGMTATELPTMDIVTVSSPCDPSCGCASSAAPGVGGWAIALLALLRRRSGPA